MILFLWTSVYVAVWYSLFKICINNIFHAIYFEHILPLSQLPNHSFKKQTRKKTQNRGGIHRPAYCQAQMGERSSQASLDSHSPGWLKAFTAPSPVRNLWHQAGRCYHDDKIYGGNGREREAEEFTCCRKRQN